MHEDNGHIEPDTATSTAVAEKPNRGKPKATGKPAKKAKTKAAPAEPKAKRAPKPAPAPVRDERAAYNAAVLLKQASDATRLQVLLMLRDGEKHVGELCDELGMSQPAVSHHLALLRHGRIIEPRRAGKNNFYGLSEAGRKLADVVAGIEA